MDDGASRAEVVLTARRAIEQHDNGARGACCPKDGSDCEQLRWAQRQPCHLNQQQDTITPSVVGQ